MKMPTFRTNTRDISDRAEATIVFSDFINTFSRKELFRAAEEYVRERAPESSIYTFRNLEDGLMGHVVDLIILASTEQAIRCARHCLWLRMSLMEHYKFTAESIPPRMLVREALAVQVRLTTVLSDLERELITSHPGLHEAIETRAEDLESPEAAYLLTDAAVDRIILTPWW